MDDIIKRKVLVLNSDYTPFSITTSKRGLKLVMRERAESLKLYENILENNQNKYKTL